MGRPTTYNQTIAKRICDLIATHDIGLGRLCAAFDDLPDKTTIYDWRNKYPEFANQYAQAKAKQIEIIIEDVIEIADDGTNDWMEQHDKDGECIGWRVNGEHIQRSRVRIDTRKWLASKLAPKIYGDQKQLEEAKEMNEALKEELRQLREQLAAKNKREY